MDIQFGSINWLAVIVTTIVMFVIGGAWYAGVFAKAWPELHGFSQSRLDAAQGRFALNMVAILAGDFVRALIVVLLIQSLRIEGLGGGLQVGLLVWIGFSLTYDVGWALSSSVPIKAFAIDSSYRLLCLLAAGAILASWQKSGAAGAIPATS
ncbi:MAG: DUF1761 domain-containing protein [Phycisphaerales bacterium JB043]